MATRIQIRRDTSTNWEANNPVLALGEPGLETDTFIVKYGDGSSAWNSLPYANIDSLADFTTANLVEQSNLYFTNTRVYANVIQLGYASNAYINSSSFATNAQLATYATNAQISFLATNAQLTVYSTNAQLTLYASNAQIATKANITDLNTSNIVEGTNLYFTNTRVGTHLSSPASTIEFNTPIRVARYTYDEISVLIASTGQLVFDTSNNVFRGYNGSSWSNLG
jgi:hypothetical protein